MRQIYYHNNRPESNSSEDLFYFCVRMAIDKNCELEQLSLAEFKECSPLIEEDIYSVISAEACVEARKTDGGPASEKVMEQIKALKAFALQK